MIHGKKSIKYDHFAEYEFRSCRAIASRLMGVTALKIRWRGKDNKNAAFYQIIHLDYSEYGIDEYREFECVPGEADMADNKREMSALWNHFIAVMGSEVTEIDAHVMMRLIADALPLASDEVSREYDDEENREFRKHALLRIGFMMDALHAAGYDEADCAGDYAIRAIMPARLSAYETINYFIMRLVDHDYPAASVLSAMPEDDLKATELASPGIQTLMRCNIERPVKRYRKSSPGISYPYRCRITTLGKDRYYHSTFVIWLNGNLLSKDPLVTDINVGSVLSLSDYEAAMQLSRPEYITIFVCRDNMPAGFDITSLGPFKGSEVEMTPNGRLFTAYKPDNSHVDKAEYRLEGDVAAYALITLGGEIAIMSHEFMDITAVDDAFTYSVYNPFIEIRGRYRIDAPVFQTLCMAAGASFSDLVEPGEEQ